MNSSGSSHQPIVEHVEKQPATILKLRKWPVLGALPTFLSFDGVKGLEPFLSMARSLGIGRGVLAASLYCLELETSGTGQDVGVSDLFQALLVR